jgi:hypothetical protein
MEGEKEAVAMNYVWGYIDTSKQVGHHHVKIFAAADSADAWFKVHDPEGVAFEYPVIEKQAGRPLCSRLRLKRKEAPTEAPLPLRFRRSGRFNGAWRFFRQACLCDARDAGLDKSGGRKGYARTRMPLHGPRYSDDNNRFRVFSSIPCRWFPPEPGSH